MGVWWEMITPERRSLAPIGSSKNFTASHAKKSTNGASSRAISRWAARAGCVVSTPIGVDIHEWVVCHVKRIVPENHLLRLVDKHIDFGFVRDRLEDSYSETGRPSIDPELLLRILLIGYLYGIGSEPKLSF
jgi:hypothetical protein